MNDATRVALIGAAATVVAAVIAAIGTVVAAHLKARAERRAATTVPPRDDVFMSDGYVAEFLAKAMKSKSGNDTIEIDDGSQDRRDRGG